MAEWISVKERLPEDGKYVLAYSADDDFMTVEARHHFGVFQITHWMQLPEPPRMATKEELFAAVRTIKEYCDSMSEKPCCACPVWRICDRCFVGIPDEWPDWVEGGGDADKKTNCSDCGNRNTPVCKYCEHDAEGGGWE